MQIHEVVYENDPDLHFAKSGVIEVLDEAKKRYCAGRGGAALRDEFACRDDHLRDRRSGRVEPEHRKCARGF